MGRLKTEPDVEFLQGSTQEEGGLLVNSQHPCPNQKCKKVIKDILLQVRIRRGGQVQFSRICNHCGQRIMYLVLDQRTDEGRKVMTWYRKHPAD